MPVPWSLRRSLAALRSHLDRLSRCAAANSSPSASQAKLDLRSRAFTSAAVPYSTGRKRLVVLGCGWAAGRLLRDIDTKVYDVTVISPRNHFVFTPLLASTCVGTLEPRSVAMPVARLQPALKLPQNQFYCAEADKVDPAAGLVHCSDDGAKFSIHYDVLAIATGSQGSTFGTPGVEEHTHFLRDVSNATAIRSQLIRNWNKSNSPGRSTAERERLLNVLIVGGGPTGVEFAGELVDFVNSDLMRLDPERARDMRITLVEANELLGNFDARLREYAVRRLHRKAVHLVKGLVKEVRPTEVVLSNGEVLEFGLCVWSTGVGPTAFTTSLPFAKTAKGRIAIDPCLRALAPHKLLHGHEVKDPSEPSQVHIAGDEAEQSADLQHLEAFDNVFAMGDCCANMDEPLPALAQVAEQQGRYLAKVLNEAGKKGGIEHLEAAPFQYHHLGSMASLGQGSAILEMGDKSKRGLSLAGFSGWLAWRSAYLTRLQSLRNRLYVMMNWTTTLFFGRDLSRF